MAKRCPYCAEEIQDEALKCKHCLSWLGPGAEPGRSYSEPMEVGFGKGSESPQGLRRPKDDRMIAGVCAAFARAIGMDPTWIRIIFAAAAFFTAGIPALILYIILALVIPTEETPERW